MENVIGAYPNRSVPALLGLLALTVSSAHGAILYSNGGPDQVSGDDLTEAIQAEDFVLASTSNLTNLRFWSLQAAAGDYSGSMFWAIYTDLSNLPGALLQGGSAQVVSESATGNSSGFAYAEYVIDIPVSFQLVTGTYWMLLHNGALTNNMNGTGQMLWGTTAVGAGGFGVYNADTPNLNPAGPWTSTLQEHAFRIDGDVVAVPEPGTWASLSIGILVLAGLGRKWRSRSV